MYNLAITIDDKYTQHASVMLKSLEANTSLPINVHCVYDKLTTRNINVIQAQFKHSHLRLHFIPFDNTVLPELPIKVNDHVTAATFFRIWLPYLLKDLDKVVFMDTDIVINGNIDELFKIDVERVAGAGVPEAMSDAKKLSLNIPLNKFYFNAGVLILNLKYFRQEHLTEKISNFIVSHPGLCEFWDQDAFNATIKGELKVIDYAYNVQSSFYEERLKDNVLVQQALKHPLVVHYTGAGACKPWYYQNRHPLKELYYKYLRLTPFKYFYPADLKRSWHFFRKIRFIFFLKSRCWL